MAPAVKPESDREHPIVAWVGIVAILAAILLISWARFAVHGTGDLEAALSEVEAGVGGAPQEPAPQGDQARRDRELEEAVAVGRWAAGILP